MRIHIEKPAWIAVLVSFLAAVVFAAMLPAQEARPGEGYLTAVGASTYRIYCANCHGKEGRGDGQVAAYLTVKPSDLTVLSQANEGKFPRDKVFRSIDGREEVRLHGRREMPIWGDALTRPGPHPEEAVKERIDGLVAYLESIQK